MGHPPLVALLGAPGTGAAELAAALRERIPADSARIVPCTCVPEEAALALLMGLDLPCPPDQRPVQEAADAHLRAALAHSAMAYRVVYGQGARRTENALKAIKDIAASAYPASAEGTFDMKIARLRTWHCEKCSDPECEHRLFTGLIKPAAPTPA